MIKIFYADITTFTDKDIFEQKMSLLCDERKEETIKYRQLPDRARSLGAGLLLQYGLRQFMSQSGMSDGQICDAFSHKPLFTKNEWGKPEWNGESKIHFNLSHSGQYVVCAVSSKSVGIDVQKKVGYKEKVAGRFFTQMEQIQLENADKNDEFYRIFCAKESYIKLTGKGMQEDFLSFDVQTKENYILNNSGNIQAFIHYIDVLEPYYTICVCDYSEENDIEIIKSAI